MTFLFIYLKVLLKEVLETYTEKHGLGHVTFLIIYLKVLLEEVLETYTEKHEFYF